MGLGWMDWTEDRDPVHPALAYHRVQELQWSPGDMCRHMKKNRFDYVYLYRNYVFNGLITTMCLSFTLNLSLSSPKVSFFGLTKTMPGDTHLP